MTLTPTDSFPPAFVAAVSEHLLPRLRDALAACAERHLISEGQGADNFSFGTDVWSLPARMFRDASAEKEIPFSVVAVPGCVLQWGETKVRHHRVGWSEKDNIASSFPGNAKALGRDAEHERQMAFPFHTTMTSADIGHIVLAYMTNPRAGLCAAYLTRVGKVEGGKVVAWSETREIYRRDAPDPPPPAPRKDAVAAEHTPAPVVRRVPKQKRNAG